MRIFVFLSFVFLLGLSIVSESSAKPAAQRKKNPTSTTTTTTTTTTAAATTETEATTDFTTTEEASNSSQTITIESTTIDGNFTVGNDTLNDNVTLTTAPEEAETTTAAPSQPEPAAVPVRFEVVVNPATLEVQRGQSYDLVCYVYGADESTIIYWIQDEPERRYALTDSDEKHIDPSQVFFRARITLDDPSKIGTYTCMAQDGRGNSHSAALTMRENNYYHPSAPVTPAPVDEGFALQPLSVVAPDIAVGDFVEMHCEGAAAEDHASIQWYFNGRLLQDEHPFYPRGRTLHIRPISVNELGTYRCSIPNHHYSDANSVIAAQNQPAHQPQPQFNPASPLSIDEGTSHWIQAPPGYYYASWARSDGQGLPSGIQQSGNDLQITHAQPDHSGTYYCELYAADGSRTSLPYEIHVRPTQTYHPPSPVLPTISINPKTINLVEGQRMIIQYTIVSNDPIEIIWTRRTEYGQQPMPAAFIVERDRLVLRCASRDIAGVYRITVRSAHGEVHEELHVTVDSQRHGYGQGYPSQPPPQPEYSQPNRPVRVTVHPTDLTVAPGQKGKLTCFVQGADHYRVTWSTYGQDTRLPPYARQQDNSVIIAPPAGARSEQIYLQCQVDVAGQGPVQPSYTPVTIGYGRRKRRSVLRIQAKITAH